MRTLFSTFISTLIFGLFFSSVSSFAYYPKSQNSEKLLTKVAFGSCNFQRRDQSYWNQIGSQDPDLWIWLGDVIYADHLPPFLRKHEYNHQKENKYYQNFSKQIPIIGTWDDHDYDSNNTSGDVYFKQDNQKLFLDFMDEPLDSPRRSQEGIYAAYRFGPKGRQIRVISLDLRYFRDEPGDQAKMLGEAQWAWLTKELLAEDSPELTLILSSSEFLGMDHPYEKWADYPEERTRLLDLLAITKGRQIFLSGDRHFAEVSRLKLPDGRSLYDLTSSGLTHTRTNSNNENRYRVGNFVDVKNFGLLTFDWNYNPVRVRYQIWAASGQVEETFLLEE